MNLRKSAFIWVILALTLALFTGCGPKQRTAEGLLDTPETHYNQGMRKLDIGDLDAAQTQFQDAIHLNKKYAPAYAGLCLVNAAYGAKIIDQKSKERKTYFEQAEKYLGKSKSYGKGKMIEPWIAHIRLFAAWKKDEGWIKDCQIGLDRALKINPRSDEAYYYMGLAYKHAFDFHQAENALRMAIEIDQSWAEKAGQALAIVHKIVEAQPGTKYGKVIALVEEIDRADLAVLFMEELNVIERIKRRDAATQSPDLSFKPESGAAPGASTPKVGGNLPTDIAGHWAESMIRDFVTAGLFEEMPDGKFYPDELVTRIEFAGSVQKLMYMVTRDQSLFTRYLGERESHLKDMRTDHPLYGAAMLCVERNIMTTDKITGYFNPDQHLSGPDALLLIRDIKNALKW